MLIYIGLWALKTLSHCCACLQRALLVNVELGKHERSCYGRVLSLQPDQYFTCLTGNPGILKSGGSLSVYRLTVLLALTKLDRARVPFHLYYVYNGLISMKRRSQQCKQYQICVHIMYFCSSR